MDVVVGPGTFPGFENAHNEGVGFGSTLGRYAGRISNPMKWSGAKYTLKPTVRGNPDVYINGNWANVAWTAQTDAYCGDNLNPCVIFSYTSPQDPNCGLIEQGVCKYDGGFPAKVVATVTYTLTDENELIVDYSVTNQESGIYPAVLSTVANMAS